jgi:3-oxoacyl-[acyl-carrier-protein] synthase III
MLNSQIISTGSYLPEKILTNHELSKLVETNNEWIIERTGIEQRHIAAEGEFTSDLGVKAAQKALARVNLQPTDIDLIVVATTTPDNTFPSTAVTIQGKLGISKCAAFDVQAVCTGFIYALSIADNFLKSGQFKRALVIGAETISRILDWQDRGTCILFGDGAGCVILEAKEGAEKSGVLSTHLYSDGKTKELLYTDGGVSSTGNSGKLRMQGKEVFKHAVTKLASCTIESLEKNNLNKNDITWLIPHQANIRILQATAGRLEVPAEKLIATVNKHGNTSAASIPLALDVAFDEGKIKRGDIISMQAIGGGLTWGSALIRF